MDESMKLKREGSHYWLETGNRKFDLNNRRSTAKKFDKLAETAEDVDVAALRLSLGDEGADHILEQDPPMPDFLNLYYHVLASFQGRDYEDVAKEVATAKN